MPYINKSSGQISIIPKCELRQFWGDSLINPPFKVTSAEVVIICPEVISQLQELPYKHHETSRHLPNFEDLALSFSSLSKKTNGGSAPWRDSW